MKVSIITPTYNSSKFIKKTIDSVIDQTFKEWEYIIIDDASEDKTTEIVDSFIKNDKRIKLIRKTINSGAADSRNIGIQKAKGKYIAFLDSDDKWHKNKLEIQIEIMEKDNLALTFTDYFIRKEDSEELEPFEALKEVVKFKNIVKFNYLACSTVVFNQEICGKHFMPKIRKRQDWGLWLSILKDNNQAKRIKQYLMYYTVRENSISDNKLSLIKYHWYIYKKFLGFNFIKASLYLINNIRLHVLNYRR